jgi:hypothetical protein
MGQKKVLTLGVAVQGEPNAVYSDWRAKTGEKDYSAWTVDAFYEQPFKDVGTVTLSGAYVKYKLGHAYLGANPEPMSYGLQGERNGWYAKAGYMLPSMPCSSSAATNSGSSPSSTASTTRSSTGPGSAPTTTSGGRT